MRPSTGSWRLFNQQIFCIEKVKDIDRNLKNEQNQLFESDNINFYGKMDLVDMIMVGTLTPG
jgi:hypothetical protein